MGLVLKKKEKVAGATGDPEKMTEKDNFEVIKVQYKYAKEVIPVYDLLYKEMENQSVALPEEVDFTDISSINMKYASAQAYLSRVTEIEISAINNNTRWKRVYNRLKTFIKNKESKLLITEEVGKLSNTSMQQAFVRNKLSSLYDKLEDVQAFLEEADAFERSVTSKKKDLQSILMNLSRQVKALSVEKSMTI